MKALLIMLLFALLCPAEEEFPGGGFGIVFDDTSLPSLPGTENTDFHWNIFRRLAVQQPRQNTMYCPLLVENLLSVLGKCATGTTKTALAPYSSPTHHPHLHCCTILAADESLPLSPSAPSVLRLPISSNPRQAAEELNSHCARLTQGNITHLITPESMADTHFQPVATVFFRAPWRLPLHIAYTATFTNARAKQEPCTMLTGDAACLVREEYKAIARSYRTSSSELLFMAILPTDNAETFLQQLSPNKLRKIREDIYTHARNGDVYLPRLNISTRPVNLLASLQQNGLTALAGPDAFYRNTISPLPIRLTSILSACSLSLDEQGTTATAAAVGNFIIVGIRPEVHFNRPFIWLICPRNPNRQPIFMGIINSLEQPQNVGSGDSAGS